MIKCQKVCQKYTLINVNRVTCVHTFYFKVKREAPSPEPSTTRQKTCSASSSSDENEEAAGHDLVVKVIAQHFCQSLNVAEDSLFQYIRTSHNGQVHEVLGFILQATKVRFQIC